MEIKTRSEEQKTDVRRGIGKQVKTEQSPGLDFKQTSVHSGGKKRWMDRRTSHVDTLHPYL